MSKSRGKPKREGLLVTMTLCYGLSIVCLVMSTMAFSPDEYFTHDSAGASIPVKIAARSQSRFLFAVSCGAGIMGAALQLVRTQLFRRDRATGRATHA